jgi:hypothetical protein
MEGTGQSPTGSSVCRPHGGRPPERKRTRPAMDEAAARHKHPPRRLCPLPFQGSPMIQAWLRMAVWSAGEKAGAVVKLGELVALPVLCRGRANLGTPMNHGSWTVPPRAESPRMRGRLQTRGGLSPSPGRGLVSSAAGYDVLDASHLCHSDPSISMRSTFRVLDLFEGECV